MQWSGISGNAGKMAFQMHGLMLQQLSDSYEQPPRSLVLDSDGTTIESMVNRKVQGIGQSMFQYNGSPDRSEHAHHRMSLKPTPAADANECRASIEAVQTRLLLHDIIRTNATSVYGSIHRFAAIESIDQFRNTVPLVTYENIRPYIEQVANGHTGILTTERVLAFFKTSGSLARPKLIPVTASLTRQKSAAYTQYWSDIYARYPAIRTGSLVTNFSDASSTSLTASGIEIFSESGFWARRSRALNSIRRLPIPAELRLISDSEARWFAAARLLLQVKLHCLMCLNPSTLLHFCRVLSNRSLELENGLRTGMWGTEDPCILDHLQSLPQSLLSQLKVDSSAADRLATVRVTADARLALLWPELDLIACWRSNLVQPYFRQLEPYIEGIAQRDYITQSSECIMAIPADDDSCGGRLAYRSHFFEFIAEPDIGLSQPQTCLAWELEPGAIYELVVTTGGGLYRYRMGDCFRVLRLGDGVPEIEFLYRSGKTSSITGEKLTEYQVILASQVTSSELAASPADFLYYPCSGHIPHYGLLIETDMSDQRCRETMRRWSERFEHHLADINSEYADKRSSGRLGQATIHLTGPGSLQQSRLKHRRPGVSDDQVKAERLSSVLDYHLRLS